MSPILQTSLLLPILFSCAGVAVADAAECDPRTRDERPAVAGVAGPAPAGTGHLGPRSTIGDLLAHPAFAGFGARLLPWDGRAYDCDMPLSEIGRLLPYHTHVDPGTVAAGLNRMIDDSGRGGTVFYDIHGAASRRQNPGLAQTGLFFFRGRPGAPFAIIAPGGGFAYVGSVHEGFPYAAAISDLGYNAFVLKYRAGQGGAVATQDMAAALGFVMEHAAALGVGTEGYSLWGSSAGARMAAAIGTDGAARHGGPDLPKPAAVVMAYTAHQAFSPNDPPTFVVVGEQDGIAPPSSMEGRIANLRRAGVAVAYRKVPGLGHGFGLGTGTAAEGWVADAVRFWAEALRR